MPFPSSSLLLLSSITIFNFLIISSNAITHYQDVQVLKQLKSTIQPSTLQKGSCIDSWDFTLDPCDSLNGEKFTCGFRCDVVSNTSRVTELVLESAGYSGSLTNVSFNLPYLQTLDFSNNGFFGSLPDSLSQLTRLQRLVLSHNSLTGPIPDSVGYISTLQELFLDNNMLTGAIPSTFIGLKSLQRLEIQGNRLDNEFPDLSQLGGLSFLDASDNSFSGGIPARFPPSVIEIALRNNQLEGNIPTGLTNSGYLQVLDLSHNRLTGSVPASLFTHPSLEQLTLSNNQFGSVQEPGNSGLGSQLISVDLSNNEIRGLLPGFMGLMPRLSALTLENNKFSGFIPVQYAMKFLVPGTGQGVEPFERLLLGGNYLFGPIPDPFLDLKAGSVTVRLGDNCLYRCPLRLFFCGGGVQKSLMECKAFGPIIP